MFGNLRWYYNRDVVVCRMMFFGMLWFCRIISRQITVVFRLLCVVGLHGLWDKGGPVGYCQEWTSLSVSNWGMSPLNSRTYCSLRCIRTLAVKCNVVSYRNVYTHWPVSMDVVHLMVNFDSGDLWLAASFLDLRPRFVHQLGRRHVIGTVRACFSVLRQLHYLSARSTTIAQCM